MIEKYLIIIPNNCLGIEAQVNIYLKLADLHLFNTNTLQLANAYYIFVIRDALFKDINSKEINAASMAISQQLIYKMRFSKANKCVS